MNEKKRALRVRALSEGAAVEMLRHLIFGLLGALLGSAELFFGVYPFGLALAAVATAYLPAVAVGAAAYAVVSAKYAMLVALGALVLFRTVLSLALGRGARSVRLFRELPAYRVTAAALAALGVGLYRVIAGGFRFYDLFGVLLAVAAAPLAALLYLGLFEKQEGFYTHGKEIGVSALVLTGVFALRTVSLFGIYPAAVAGVCAVLLLAAHKGALPGAVGGALIGLCFDPRLAPSFLLFALGFALLQKSSRGGGVIAGAALASVYAYLIFRESGILQLLPSLLVAGALFLAFDSAGLVEGAPMRHLLLSRRRAALQSVKAERDTRSAARLQELSGAFLDLSSTLYELSSRMRRPAQGELRRLCDKAFESVCASCRNRDICWGSAYRETVATVEEMTRRLSRQGMLSQSGVEGELAARCTELPRIIAVINNGATALCEETLHGDKTSVVAMDYAAMGRVIADTLSENEAAFTCDTAAGERIYRGLLRMGYQLESAAVCGSNRRRVILRGLRPQGKSLRLRELRAVIGKQCRFAPGEASVTEHEGLFDVVLEERRLLVVESVRMTRPKSERGTKHCGDSVAALTLENGMTYSFICDGMGSGNTAALTSALASVFLTRLLQAGGRADSTLRMLNGFLAARSRSEGESSTTVDLLEIDRVKGEAALYKCGAATTFLLREGRVTRFFSRTAPVGILEALDAERIGFQVQAGDVLLQVSDGFTAGEEDCPWLEELLETRYDGDAEAFARMALNRATGKHNDDLSLVLTVITAAPPVTSADTRESA